MRITTLMAGSLALALTATSADAVVYCEVSQWPNDGFNGQSAKCPDPTPGPQGQQGPQGEKGDKGDQGPIGPAGADGQDFDMDKSLALNAALSLPGWLETHEKMSVTGGFGFSEGGETALGVTGIVRINKNAAGVVGGAVSTDGGAWAGKAGVRLGW